MGDQSGTVRVIAIDGPGGSGKSTVAKLVAQKTGLPYLDTGAMYRAVTFGVLQRGVDPTDWSVIDEILPQIDLDLSATTVMVDGADATEAIRGNEVTAHVSEVSANPTVRHAMVELQREWIRKSAGGVLERRCAKRCLEGVRDGVGSRAGPSPCS